MQNTKTNKNMSENLSLGLVIFFFSLSLSIRRGPSAIDSHRGEGSDEVSLCGIKLI
jgi:hypothetical protein